MVEGAAAPPPSGSGFSFPARVGACGEGRTRPEAGPGGGRVTLVAHGRPPLRGSAAQLSDLTGQIGRLVQKLIARGLVERTPGTGRGRPQVLSVKPSPAAKKLIDVMMNG